MLNNIKKLFAVLLVLTLFAASAAPAYASGTDTELDFSASDDINAYDSYAKRELEDGREFVFTNASYRYDHDRPNAYKNYRFGAYLRNPDEKQLFSFLNVKYQTTTADDNGLKPNVLTVYADPEVDFNIVDYNGISIANSTGWSEKSKVSYYNKSTENGHIIYYLELIPVGTTNTRHLIEFSTTSTAAQPHYSFWYGHPVMKTATASCGSFSLSVRAPSKSSTSFPLATSYSIPDRAWVTKVMVTRTSVSGANQIVSGQVTVKEPKATKFKIGRTVAQSTAEFECPANVSAAFPARGTYNFALTSMSWENSTSGSYTYRGNATIEYVYAVGA